MRLLFQCSGITGLVLMLYGLAAFAVTKVSTWFFWALLLTGALLVVVFAITSLSRNWQATVGALAALNVAWIAALLGKTWPVWAQVTAVGVCVAALFLSAAKEMKWAAVISVIVAGSYWGMAALRGKEWHGYVILGAAFLYNAAFIYLARIFLRDLFARRSLQQGANTVIYSLVVIAIIIVANVAGQDFYKRIDLTENQVNTLSEQSVKIIKSLADPVKLTAFFDERNPKKGAMKALLESYSTESKKVETTFADPDRDKTLAETHKAKDGNLIVEYKGQSHLLAEDKTNEEGITQAIIKVTRVDSPFVCFTKGHRELDIDGPDEDERSLSGIKGAIENEGYKPKAVEAMAGEVPAECAILVVAGPQQAFTEIEAKAIDSFLTKGGKGVFLMDPNVGDPRLGATAVTVMTTGLEATIKKWGVDLGKDIILEQFVELFKGMQTGATVRAQQYGNHPIVDPLKGQQTVFQNARSLKKAVEFDGTTVELVSSAPEGMSWGETDIRKLVVDRSAENGPQDVQGPVTLAMSVEREGEKTEEEPSKATRLVVFGDSDFVSNRMVRSYGANFDLFLNTLNWLQGETQQISIRPKKLKTSAIELTPDQQNTIFYVAIITIPMLVLIFGMDLWWIRRRRG